MRGAIEKVGGFVLYLGREFPGTVYSNSQFRRGKGEKSKFSIGYNHDKASLDIFWLRDESLEESDNIPDPDVLAQEIADDLETALEQFREIAMDLGGQNV